MKKKDKKKKKMGSVKDLIKQIRKEYPNRPGEVEINYHRKGGHDYVFAIREKDYFAEFFARGLLHPIPQLNAAYYYAGLKLRWAYYSSFSHQKLIMHYGEKQSSGGYDQNNVPIRDGYKWYSILINEIPRNCREVVDLVVIRERPTNGSGTRQKSALMSKLSDGLGSILDFLDQKRKKRAYA